MKIFHAKKLDDSIKKTQKTSKNTKKQANTGNISKKNKQNQVVAQFKDSQKIVAEIKQKKDYLSNDLKSEKQLENVDFGLALKNSIKTVVKILAVSFILFVYLFVVLFIFAPDFCAKVCDFLGAKVAQERCLVRVYEKSHEPFDLYNLILVQDEHNNYDGELKSVQKLLSLEDFDLFCDALDQENLRNSTKDKYGYVANSRSYLLGREVKCLIMFYGNANAKVYENLVSTNLTENTFAVAVRTILNNSNFSDSDKRNKIDELFSTWDSSLSQDDIESLVLARLENLKNYIDNVDGAEKIIAGFSLYEMAGALLNAKIAQGESSSIEEAKSIYNEARQIYKDMIL